MCRLPKEEILYFPRTFAVTVELGQSTGAEAFPLPCDLGDGDRSRRLIEGFVRRYGRLEILFKSAIGLTQSDGTFWGIPHGV
jgi:hypothetical protein